MRIHGLGEHGDEERRKKRPVVKMNGTSGKNWRN